ncbi:MAG: hypothetical protein NTZ24_14345 [Deltaproteobacteria bacterium]|nr:hypothetical protein [Deltaproteobacteria bacterium]
MKISKFRFVGYISIIAALGIAGCASAPPVKEYTPLRVTSPLAGTPTLKAAVVLTVNQSPTPSESEMNERLADVLKERKRFLVTPQVTAVTGCMVGSEKFTEILIKELKASGFFVSVDGEGAGPADVLVKPVLKTCIFSIIGLNIHNVFDFEMQVQVLKRGKLVMDKTYTERWQPLDMADLFNQLFQERLPPVMKQIRDDIVASLAQPALPVEVIALATSLR